MILPQKAFSDTILYLDMDSLLKNLEVFQGLVAKNVKIMAMIKANAYGTGAVTIAKALEKKILIISESLMQTRGMNFVSMGLKHQLW